MAVYGGSVDYLLPSLFSGASGCVVGMGNVFPKSVSRLYDYWKAGRIEEATQLQEKIAEAEWACKKSLNNTKYGAWWFIGRGLGLESEDGFVMRRPYARLSAEAKRKAIETLGVLEEIEKKMEGREGIAP